MDEKERSDSISDIEEQQNSDLLNSLMKKIKDHARLSFQNVLGNILLVFADTGLAKQLNVEHLMQISMDGKNWGLAGLKINCINITLKKSFLQSYSVHIAIPISLIRTLGKITVIESSGLIQVELKPEYILYVAEPSFLGWAFMLEDLKTMLPMLELGKKLSSYGVLINEMDTLIQKAIRLSIASKASSELRAVPSPIVVKPEDFQEQIREKLMKLGMQNEQ